jgi:U4/U6 small nuclear ribonucleoprotein SNU13
VLCHFVCLQSLLLFF